MTDFYHKPAVTGLPYVGSDMDFSLSVGCWILESIEETRRLELHGGSVMAAGTALLKPLPSTSLQPQQRT
jgi:hypothetical protein